MMQKKRNELIIYSRDFINNFHNGGMVRAQPYEKCTKIP